MKKQALLIIAASSLLVFAACKEKKTAEPNEVFIPVTSIINDQVNHIDTSLYSIVKITYRDSITADTEYIRREDFRALATDFLKLPELSKKRYKEENIPGPLDNLSTIIYTPIQPDQEEVKRVELIIDPSLAEEGTNVIKSIYIDRSISNKDSAWQKKMLWQMNKSFMVTTLLQKKDQPETNTTVRVTWNENE